MATKTLEETQSLYDFAIISVSAAGAHPHSIGYRGELPNNPMTLEEFKEYLEEGLPKFPYRMAFITIRSKILKSPGIQEGDRFVWDSKTKDLFRCQFKRLP